MLSRDDKSNVELVDRRCAYLHDRVALHNHDYITLDHRTSSTNNNSNKKKGEPFHVFLLLLILGDIFHHDGTNSSSHFHLFFSKRAAHLDDDDADDDAAVRRACAQLTAGRHGPSVAMTTRSAAPSVHINRHATCALPSFFLFIFIVNIPPAALLFSLYLYIYIYIRAGFICHWSGYHVGAT